MSEEDKCLKSEFPSSVLTIVNEYGFILQYGSAQYHIHVGSEHKVDGHQAALEFHIVHKLNPFYKDVMTYAVVGLLFDIDDSNTTNLFEQIDFTKPQRVNFKKIMMPFLIGNNVYYYKGSLTTPKCNEAVNWYVVQKIFTIRPEQLASIASLINDG